MEGAGIIECEWCFEARDWSKHKLFAGDKYLMEYDAGGVFRRTRVTIGDQSFSFKRELFRNTLISDVTGESFGSYALLFVPWPELVGWRIELPNGSRFCFNSQRVWEEDSGTTQLFFVSIPGVASRKNCYPMRALDGPDFLILAAISADAIFRRDSAGG
jgi:hypothetical protein